MLCSIRETAAVRGGVDCREGKHEADQIAGGAEEAAGTAAVLPVGYIVAPEPVPCSGIAADTVGTDSCCCGCDGRVSGGLHRDVVDTTRCPNAILGPERAAEEDRTPGCAATAGAAAGFLRDRETVRR